jgi:hypothetical protein
MMKGVRDRRSGKTVVVSAPLEDDKKNEEVVVLRRNLIVGLLSLVLVLSLSGLGFAYTFATYSEKPFAGTEINVALVAEPRSDGLMKLLPEFEELTGIKDCCREKAVYNPLFYLCISEETKNGYVINSRGSKQDPVDKSRNPQ